MISERTFQIAAIQWKAYCELRPVVKEAFGEELPEELLEVLNELELLISATYGSLRSRQVIAGLIVTWGLTKISEREKEE